MSSPPFTTGHAAPAASPSGAVFYDGDAFPDWRGDLFAGTLAGRYLGRFTVEGAGATDTAVTERDSLPPTATGGSGHSRSNRPRATSTSPSTTRMRRSHGSFRSEPAIARIDPI